MSLRPNSDTEMVPPPSYADTYDVNPEVGLLSNSDLHKEIKELRRRNLFLSLLSLAFMVGLIVSSSLALAEPRKAAAEEQATRLPGAGKDSQRVLLVSFDGFRWDYASRSQVVAPNLRRLRKEATTADSLISVYPSKTFPNHYSIATGLYPPWHGIVHNGFCYKGKCFNMSNTNPEWWLGEPMWETVTRQGKSAYTYYWPGSETVKGKWKCPDGSCAKYPRSENNDPIAPYNDRVDALVEKLRGSHRSKWPSFMTLYFEETDHVGHRRGTDVPQMTAAIHRVDSVVGYIMDQLQAIDALDHLHLIIVGDHGMVDVCQDRQVLIDELLPEWDEKWANITQVDSWGPIFAACPEDPEDADALFSALDEANQEVDGNERGMDLYLRDGAPASLLYNSELSDRICPVLGVAREGYMITTRSHQQNKTDECRCGGTHGYDPALQSMRTIFYGRGARFEPGKTVAAFKNVEIYNIVAEIIGVKAAPNNGTAAFANTVLLSPP